MEGPRGRPKAKPTNGQTHHLRTLKPVLKPKSSMAIRRGGIELRTDYEIHGGFLRFASPGFSTKVFPSGLGSICAPPMGPESPRCSKLAMFDELSKSTTALMLCLIGPKVDMYLNVLGGHARAWLAYLS